MADWIPVCASDCVCELGMDVVDAVLGLGVAEGVCERLLVTSDAVLSVAVSGPVCTRVKEQDRMPTAELHNLLGIPEREGCTEQWRASCVTA